MRLSCPTNLIDPVNLFEVTGIQGNVPVRGAMLLERSYDVEFGDAAETDSFEFTFGGERWLVEVHGLSGGCPLD